MTHTHALASPSDRIVAAVIDAIIASIIQFGIGITLWVIGLGWLGTFLAVAYMILRDNLAFLNYQSIGKKLVKIKVVNKIDHSPIDLATSFKRNLIFIPNLLNAAGFTLIYVSGGIILIWLIVEFYRMFNTPDKQRLGDELAATIVVKEVL